MRDLSYVIDNCYTNPTCTSRGYGHRLDGSKTSFMVIPITGEIIEVPVFACDILRGSYKSEFQNGNIDSIVVELGCQTFTSAYKSLDACIRDVLYTSCKPKDLVKFNIEDRDNPYYFGTKGAIFDRNLKPLMLMTWQIQRTIKKYDSGKELWEFRFLKPVLRIDPEIFVSKKNVVERYIANKITTKTLSLKIRNSFTLSSISDYPLQTVSPKVIIDTCPFPLKEIDKPSISTSNEKLIKLALSNLEEMAE